MFFFSRKGNIMKKRTYKIAALILAAAMAAGTPISSYAWEVEEEILRGTSDTERVFEGEGQTVEQTAETDSEVVSGTAGLSEEEQQLQEIKEHLDKAEQYLQNNVTDPVVDTLGGEWSVIAMARYGNLMEATKMKYLANLYQTLDEKEGILDAKKYTEYSRVALALTAVGIHPSEVNGYDILLKLAEFENVKWQGVNGPIWALIALDSHNYEVPELKAEKLTQTTRENLIAEILGKQLEDGGWALSGAESDADMTAMAILALSSYYQQNQQVKTALDKAFDTLSKMQTEDGGFASWGTGNLESAAQVVMAFSAFDANLLEDERFVKNGNSVLDYLLRYQLADGSFVHALGDTEADAMATDQGALALLAYYRAKTGQNSLFDMSDVSIDMEEGEESREAVEAFRGKLQSLSEEIRIKDQQTLYALLTELDQMKSFEEKETFRAELQKKMKEVEKQIAEVEALDEDIWEQINPLAITIADRDTILELTERYNKLPKENQEYVTNREDLFAAKEVIQKLQMILSEVASPFGGIKGAEVSADETEQQPAAATGAVAKNTNNTAAKSSSGKKKAEESNTIDAEVKDGIVAKTEVEKVKGQEKNLRMKGTLEDKTEYILTLNGKDVKEASDIHIGISRKSEYEEEIRKLAADPAILTFSQEGNFPGAVQVEVSVEKADGEYLLLYYNAEAQKAEYVQKIQVKDKQTKFLIEKGGSYFIDKKVSTKSLKEKNEKEEQTVDTDTEEVILQGMKEEPENRMPYIVVGSGLGLIIIGGGIYVIASKKRKNNRED